MYFLLGQLVDQGLSNYHLRIHLYVDPVIDLGYPRWGIRVYASYFSSSCIPDINHINVRSINCRKVSEIRFQDRYLGTTINEPLIYILFKDACEICIILSFASQQWTQIHGYERRYDTRRRNGNGSPRKSKNPLESYFW